MLYWIFDMYSWLPHPLDTFVLGVITIFIVWVVLYILKIIMDIIPFA